MRAMTVTTLVLGLTLASLMSAVGTDSNDATTSVELLVHTELAGEAGLAPGEPDLLVGTARCTVEVPSGSNAGDLLDQAVADGCILEWDYDDFDGDRFVTSVDGLRAVGLTCLAWPHACDWWEFRVNGAGVGFGIDDYSASSGDVVEFFFHTA